VESYCTNGGINWNQLRLKAKLPAHNSRESTLRKQVSKLKRLLADKTVEMDFFRSALQKVRARRQQNDVSGEKASTKKC